MKYGLILAGAVLTCGVALPMATTQAAAAPQGAILLADDDHSKDTGNHDQHGPSGGQHPPAGPQGHTDHTQNHMGGNSNTMTGHPPGGMGGPGNMGGGSTTMGHGPNTMSGHNMMGGHNSMTGQGSHNFDRHSFQRNVTAARHFHIGGYARPHGWYSHHWTYGEILPALFWSQTYWLTDFYDYGLDAPPPGFVWVRDGDDALLVDMSSGEILQVDYGVFD